MASREKALKELKKQIKEQKARLDPKVLKMAEKAAALSQEGKVGEDMVPYDRDAAARAIEIFLQAHGNREHFEERLMALLRRTQGN